MSKSSSGDRVRDAVRAPEPTRMRRIPRRGPNAPPILFPTEPTSIPRERIDEAVRSVIAARKK